MLGYPTTWGLKSLHSQQTVMAHVYYPSAIEAEVGFIPEVCKKAALHFLIDPSHV